MPTPAEWSVIAMYSWPRSRTAATMSRRGCLPSPLQSLCRCMSPRMSASSTSSGRSFCARQLELAVVLAQLGRDRLVAEVAVDLVLVGRPEDLAALDVLDAPLRDAHAASLRVLAHAHVVALRAGEVLQEVAVALERHDAQVELHAVVRHDRGLRRAVAEHLGHERLLDQPGRQGRPVGRRGDHVDVAHGLGAAAQRSRLVGRSQAGCARSGSSTVRASSSAWSMPERALARSGARLDLRQELLLLALAEAREPLQAALARGRLEVGERRDAELLPELARRLGAEAGQADDLDEALGDAAAQLLERRHRAGLAQLADLRRDRVADVVELGQAALLRERPDRLGRLAEALRGPAVGEHAVHDRAVQLVEVAEQVEQVGDLGIAQRAIASIVPAAAWPATCGEMGRCRCPPGFWSASPRTTSARTSSG